MAHPDFLIIAP